MKSLENHTLGKYDVLKEIGRGSMGTVYLGYDPFAGRKVAIKVANPDALADERSGARFRKLFFNEAKIAGMLKHPNIVAVYDAGIEDDLGYIVMEYVPNGGTLHAHCRVDNLLPMEEAVRVMYKCAKAIDFAHRKGVIHRDIKPRNILVSGEGNVKIGDFSIALTTHIDAEDTQVHGYLGSPLYMSPEQVRMDTVTNRSDLFSMGIVLYELLCGHHPFSADSLPGITHRITSGQATPMRDLRTDVPTILQHILSRLLKKDPRERYQMGLDLAADLSLVYDHIDRADAELPGREKFKLVGDLSFFQDFPESEVWEVINASSWRDFDPGSEIIIEGDSDNCFYVIVNGDVDVRKGHINVDVLTRGDCFGEMGFIAKHARTATIIAKSPVSVMQVRAGLMERASLNCQLRFHKAFLRTMIGRLSKTTAQVSKAG
jgi:serine/threonine protein kinase